MEGAIIADTNVTPHPTNRALIAPAWHTIVFIAIIVGISVLGGFFQHAVKQHPLAVVPSSSVIPGYISVVVFEWLLVLYVRMGVHKRGMRLRDLVGGRRGYTERVNERHRPRRSSLGGVDRLDECSCPG